MEVGLIFTNIGTCHKHASLEAVRCECVSIFLLLVLVTPRSVALGSCVQRITSRGPDSLRHFRSLCRFHAPYVPQPYLCSDPTGDHADQEYEPVPRGNVEHFVCVDRSRSLSSSDFSHSNLENRLWSLLTMKKLHNSGNSGRRTRCLPLNSVKRRTNEPLLHKSHVTRFGRLRRISDLGTRFSSNPILGWIEEVFNFWSQRCLVLFLAAIAGRYGKGISASLRTSVLLR